MIDDRFRYSILNLIDSPSDVVEANETRCSSCMCPHDLPRIITTVGFIWECIPPSAVLESDVGVTRTRILHCTSNSSGLSGATALQVSPLWLIVVCFFLSSFLFHSSWDYEPELPDLPCSDCSNIWLRKSCNFLTPWNLYPLLSPRRKRDRPVSHPWLLAFEPCCWNTHRWRGGPVCVVAGWRVKRLLKSSTAVIEYETMNSKVPWVNTPNLTYSTL